MRAVITAGPTVVLRHGQLQHDALRASRLAESEVLQAVRSSGSGDLSQVGAVVLETNGTLSVITEQQMGDSSALHDLR